ncbi:unnamed protein product [Nesidiocoris tenuis]|uniref:Uncharacterized protein n=1 Tax=Nesidiocoris tenuis TaxID=355587 RepID=A0A6H5GZU2_9HEMI|nr:unnamed protein product [Nesidiocoris tenuis]
MVMMTSKLLGIDLDMRLLDVVKGEQFTPEYLQINPQHTVPALDDNGFKISESRAIAAYLTTLAPDGDKLYPNDPKKKALVDQIMYFDLDKVYKRVLDRFVFDVNATPMVAGAPYTKVKGDLLDSTFRTLELYIARGPWFAGDAMTIADVAILTSVSLAEVSTYRLYQFPNKYRRKVLGMWP